MRCNKAELQVSNTPSNPVETQYSCGFSAYHLPKNRAYVLNRRLIHFRFLAHSLANARSLGLRRADDTITVLAAPPAR